VSKIQSDIKPDQLGGHIPLCILSKLQRHAPRPGRRRGALGVLASGGTETTHRELVAWTVKLGVPVILERVVLVRVRPHTGVDPPRARGSRGAHIW